MKGKKYSSYPEDRPDVEQAEAVVCEKAVKHLRLQQQAAGVYPVTPDIGTCIVRVTEVGACCAALCVLLMF